MSGRRSGRGWVISSRAGRGLPASDGRNDLGLGQADRDELGQPAVVADDAERPVAGVHQPGRGLDDLAQHHLEVELAADRDNRLEQRVHPVPGGQHRLQPGLQLGEQVVEAQLRHDRA
jgi:hypothetical protein